MSTKRLAPRSKMALAPERLSISIGGHFGTSFSVCFEGGLLTYQRSKPVQNFPPKWDSWSEQIQPSDERWQAFRAALDLLSVWSWQQRYTDPEVCDGTGWSVEIAYADKAVVSGGSNCFPGQNGRPISIVDRSKDDTFDKFCRAVSELVGSEFQ
jgi:hypothetical protein